MGSSSSSAVGLSCSVNNYERDDDEGLSEQMSLTLNSSLSNTTAMPTTSVPTTSGSISPRINLNNKTAITERQSSMGSFVTKKLGFGQKRKLDKLLLKLFTKDYQPFSVVEDSGFKAFVTELNPSYKLPDRKTISGSLIPAAYEECMHNVLTRMATVKSVCLTTDCWSSAAQDSFIAVTAHFIDDEFKFESVLLECSLIEGSHTSVALASEIKRITDRFEVTNKV